MYRIREQAAVSEKWRWMCQRMCVRGVCPFLITYRATRIDRARRHTVVREKVPLANYIIIFDGTN